MTVVLLGSSGGGTATLGHTDPTDLLRSIHQELSKIEHPKNIPIQIEYGLYLSLHGGKGLDSACAQNTMATLYQIQSEKQILQIIPIKTDILEKVNALYKQLDREKLTPLIKSGSIIGMISISSDPLQINASSFTALSSSPTKISVTGSGGTSLSTAVVQYGIQLVGNAGGSVGTTNYTKAVSYSYALASSWRYRYHPWNNKHRKDVIQPPTMKSILEACIPAFLGVCISTHILEYIAREYPEMELKYHLSHIITKLRQEALPLVCCVVCASAYAPEHKSILLMASCIAASVCSGSILGGLLAGYCVAWLVERVLFLCIRFHIPATMTNILVAGGSGSIAALCFNSSPILVVSKSFTVLLRTILQSPPILSDIPGAGFVFGCIFCFGSKIGWYHSIYLPLILIEMECGKGSIWGSVDECTLVLVSAGICSGNLLMSHSVSSGDAALSKRGLYINLLCGDFIEAAYPFMERSKIVNFFSYLACGASTEILYSKDPTEVLSSAYVPFWMSIWLANDWKRMGTACVVAFGISFVGSIIGNIWGGKDTEVVSKEENNKVKKEE